MNFTRGQICNKSPADHIYSPTCKRNYADIKRMSGGPATVPAYSQIILSFIVAFPFMQSPKMSGGPADFIHSPKSSSYFSYISLFLYRVRRILRTGGLSCILPKCPADLRTLSILTNHPLTYF